MKKSLLAAFLLTICSAALSFAGQDHSSFFSDPFKTGQDVTKQCIQCHSDEAKSFLKSAHWTWSKKQVINGKEVEFGKKNAVNNFCVSVPSNWPRCTGCHAGYGWKDANFDFSNQENIDCLVCHDTTGKYKKFPTGAGHPVYPGEDKSFGGKKWEPVDLLKSAQSVGMPSRTACGACHFYGGGGDRVKHGDLDGTLANPTREIDVHMGGAGMTCVDCHRGGDHSITGEAASVSVGTGDRAFGCVDCHDAAPHRFARYNEHAKKIACQTCHIPSFAKAKATKTWWDWSTAGKDIKPIPKTEDGDDLYAKIKGDFKWEKDVKPTYYWYNGTVDRVMFGDKINPKSVVRLSAAKGDMNDPNAKIFPFKVMRGKQPYDSGNNTLVAVNTFGPDGYWTKFDWQLAIKTGMEASNLPYSGKFGWIETSMVWPINHMVAPKEQSLKCLDCHGSKSRMDWKALGYGTDPFLKK
ncbi:MAG: tetrathionate reductase family octaheme c-type cytochrome [Trichlorobacter sp.]|jgi:octaheme c-type cytochrome (tetrathionate reductase family)|nr:tetrathionate reductase family octaheme c-type cytochrome [Trichlorobacter sp.]